MTRFKSQPLLLGHQMLNSVLELSASVPHRQNKEENPAAVPSVLSALHLSPLLIRTPPTFGAHFSLDSNHGAVKETSHHSIPTCLAPGRHPQPRPSHLKPPLRLFPKGNKGRPPSSLGAKMRRCDPQAHGESWPGGLKLVCIICVNQPAAPSSNPWDPDYPEW